MTGTAQRSGAPAAAVRARLLHRAERCQFEESPLERPTVLRWARAGVIWGRRAWRERAAPPGPGRPSVFAAGDSVRVRSVEEIQATLDADHTTRGLAFTAEQWGYCSGTYRVARSVRRMLDDQWRMRPIQAAVVLDGVTCDGIDGTGGCGRSCALLWKDEWLAPSPEPAPPAPPRGSGRLARVRTRDDIEATLGADGRIDGISPPPHPDELAGTVQAVTGTWDIRLRRPSPLGRAPRAAWYLLDGVRCDGSVLGAAGPCDRCCPLLWHESWLEFLDD